MDDIDFFSLLHQQWSKTTGAEDRYWMPEEYTDRSGRWNLYAVAQDETRKLVASSLNEVDAEFFSAIHGCLPDLVRRLNAAIDESDRLDAEKDDAVCRVAVLEQEADRYVGQLISKDERIAELEREASEADAYVTSIEKENTKLEAEIAARRADRWVR